MANGKSNLETQTKHITGIVSLRYDSRMQPLGLCEVAEIINNLKEYFDVQSVMYSFILHAQDLDDDFQPKTPHIHFTADMANRARLSSWLSRIAQICDVAPLAVSIEKYTDFSSCVQYQLHKRQPEKFQYTRDYLITSLDEGELQVVLEAESNEITFDVLVKVCEESRNLIEVGHKLGIGIYAKYRPTIADIWKTLHGNALESHRKDPKTDPLTGEVKVA